jgi:hypothetical protein
VTPRLIREEVYADASEAREVSEAGTGNLGCLHISNPLNGTRRPLVRTSSEHPAPKSRP